jgi:hypothetical protein
LRYSGPDPDAPLLILLLIPPTGNVERTLYVNETASHHSDHTLEPSLKAVQTVQSGDGAAATTASGQGHQETAYDACEVAMVLFLSKYGKALLRKSDCPTAALPMLAKGGEPPPHRYASLPGARRSSRPRRSPRDVQYHPIRDKKVYLFNDIVRY